MKNTLQSFLLMLFIGSAVLLSAQSKSEQKAFKKTVENLIKNWVTTPENFDEYEQAGTYIPDMGIRGKYYLNKNLLSLAKLAQITGEQVFTGGPHSKDIDYTSGSFGKYNPLFLKKLHSYLKTLLADKKFVIKSRDFYDNNLKKLMQSYWHAYQHSIAINTKKEAAVSAYRQYILADPSTAAYNMQEYFRPFSDEMEPFGYMWYELNTAALFWTRRAMDASDQDFYNLMKLMIQTYDPTFIQKK